MTPQPKQQQSAEEEVLEILGQLVVEIEDSEAEMVNGDDKTDRQNAAYEAAVERIIAWRNKSYVNNTESMSHPMSPVGDEEIDKILKQYSTDVQKGRAATGLVDAREAILAYTERKVLEAELEGHVHAEKAILLALTGFNKPPGGKPGSIPDYAIRQAAVHLEESEKKLNHLKESK